MEESQGSARKENIKIPILWGSDFDLTRFDFSFIDIQILDIHSGKFINYFKSLEGESFQPEAFPEVLQEIESEKIETGPFYAIVKNNPLDNFKYADIYLVYQLLHIAYPSDLQIFHVIDYAVASGIHSAAYSQWNLSKSSPYPGDILYTHEEDIPFFNEFAKNHFQRLKANNYLGFIIENYETSFSASHYHFRYLSLCMALEGLIDGKAEITYRLNRTVAILCGNSDHRCTTIFNNMKVIYDVRSAIIHGNTFDNSTVIDFLKTLRAIVSKVIIELLIHDFTNIVELGRVITKVGFGDNPKLSDEWKDFEFNKLNKVRMLKVLKNPKSKNRM